jgi:hypothetical protein
MERERKDLPNLRQTTKMQMQVDTSHQMTKISTNPGDTQDTNITPRMRNESLTLFVSTDNFAQLDSHLFKISTTSWKV